MPNEKELDIALATELASNPAFLNWLVAYTKFADSPVTFHSCRSDWIWGKHPFPTTDPISGITTTSLRESETDVLLLVKDGKGRNLAIHIENKIGISRFTKQQPEMYPHRAAHWINDPGHGSYSDFDTVLLAPAAFQQRNAAQSAIFGCFVSHEAVANFIPLFGEATSAT